MLLSYSFCSCSYLSTILVGYCFCFGTSALLLQSLIQSSPLNSHLSTGGRNISHVLFDSVKTIVSIVNGQDPSVGGTKAFQMQRYMINLLLATQENHYEGDNFDSDYVLYFTISRLAKISKELGKSLITPIHYDRTRVAINVYEKCKQRGLVRIKKKHGAQWVGITREGDQETLNMIEKLVLKLPEERRPKLSKEAQIPFRKPSGPSSQIDELAREITYLSDEKKSNIYTSYIADSYYELKKYREAINRLDEAIKLNSGNATAYDIKGLALMKFGRYQEAVACFDKVLEIDPTRASVWMNRGNALDDSGKYGEAIKSYRKALEIQVDPWLTAEVLNNMGLCFHNLGENEEEMKCYDKALEIVRYVKSGTMNPSEDHTLFVEAHTWFLKGNLLRKLGKYGEARDCYEESLRINPANAETWLNKGVCYYNLGEPEEARKCYDKATEIDPNNAKPWYNKYILGQSDAQQCLNKAKELGFEI